jgi:hypothetical protein
MHGIILKKYIFFTVAMAIFAFVTYFLCFTEIGDRFAIYHNYISMNLKIDGIQQDLKGTKIEYSTFGETRIIIETGFFSSYSSDSRTSNGENRAKFKKGLYGDNDFRFVIKKAFLKGFRKDIQIIFGGYNTNWWHINKCYVDVVVNQISTDRAKIILSQRITHRTDGGRLVAWKHRVIKEVSLTNNSISIYDGFR